ncbi:MAG: hypothetical protein V8T01_07100 [Oscillospiraceae bacterium]
MTLIEPAGATSAAGVYQRTNGLNSFFGSCDCNGDFLILWRIRSH